jgi:spore coat polysaccharide biosynthesis protein SpsF
MGRRRSHVLLCAAAGSGVGFGHARRAHAVAVELRRRGIDATMVLKERGPQADWLVTQKETPRFLEPELDEATALMQAAQQCRAPVVTLDLPAPLGRHAVLTLKRAGRAVVMIENEGPGRLAADLVVSSVSRPALSWRGAAGVHLASPAYAILGETFRPMPKRSEGPPRVLVSMGANDADGMTSMAIAAVDRVRHQIHPVLVVGPGCRSRSDVQDALVRTARQWEVHYAVPELAPLAASADVAVAAFGLAAYELAAAGVPAVLVPRRDADRWHAELFAAAGAAVVAERTTNGIAEALGPLLAGTHLRRRYSLAAEQLVDGRGAERVAELLSGLAAERERAGRRAARRRGTPAPSLAPSVI